MVHGDRNLGHHTDENTYHIAVGYPGGGTETCTPPIRGLQKNFEITIFYRNFKLRIIFFLNLCMDKILKIKLYIHNISKA